MSMVSFSPFLSNAVSYILGGISVRLVDPANNDAKMKLAEIYEIMGEPRKALDLVYEGNQLDTVISGFFLK